MIGVPKPPKREKRPRKPIVRGKRPAKVNRARKAREFARVYESEARVLWVQSLPCVVTGLGPCENAHIRGGGAGRKADSGYIVPLLPALHRTLHSLGKLEFERLFAINLTELATATEDAWAATLTARSTQ